MAAILDQSYTVNDNNATDDIGQLRRGTNNQEKWGVKFTPTVTSTITQVDLYLKKQGTPTGNIWVEIWSDNGGGAGGLPNAQIGSNASNYDVSTVPGTSTWITFTFPTPPPTTAGTIYWIVLNGDYALSTTNAVQWRLDDTGTTGARYGNGGPQWETRTYDMLFKEYHDTVAVLSGNFQFI